MPSLSFEKYYEHTHAICNVLNGVPPPKLSPELEARLKAMFAEIQEPFERNCPPNRKNFLSYSFTLHKMCELLGEVSRLESFTTRRRPRGPRGPVCARRHALC